MYRYVAPLFHAGSAEGPISLYRVNLKRSYLASSHYRAMDIASDAIDNQSNAFGDTFLHELVHVADMAKGWKLSDSEEWRALVEPRIAAVRFAVPEGSEDIHQAQRRAAKANGLPTVYAAQFTGETLAEVITYTVDFSWGYRPPDELLQYIRKCMSNLGSKDPSIGPFRKGEQLCIENQKRQAVEQYTEAIRLDPRFIEAIFSRGTVLLDLGSKKEALADFSDVIKLASPYRAKVPV